MKSRIILGLLAGLSLSVAIAADATADVRDLMSANQFHATGLDTRSPEQLTAFDTWLASYAHSAPASGAAPADVRDLMSARQFHDTGLDALKPEQVAAFNAWLASYAHSAAPNAGAVPAAAPAMVAPVPAVHTPVPTAASNAAAFGAQMLPPARHDEPKLIESTLPGHFTGWSGETVFTLANGQVWKQAERGSFEANLTDPPVVIKRLMFGYLLTLPGQSATVFVKRVQ
jgi:hypothetical protein